GPVRHEIARICNGGVRKGLTDDRHGDAVNLSNDEWREYRVAEIGRGHVLGNEIDLAFEVVLQYFLYARGSIGEFPMARHDVYSQLQTRLHHVLPARPQCRGRSLPGIAS